MGARFRLPASFYPSGYYGDARIIVEALKRYGMIVSDNGSGWYNQLKTIPGSAFEVVDTGPILTS